jgi:tRNA modification GTPase
VLQLLLARCIELGARLARPGEFTLRAFLNGKLDLAQAESVADLIDAATATAARAAARSLSGAFSSEVRALTDALIELRMFTEATLDFPEEDVDFLRAADARGKLDAIAARVNDVLLRAKQGRCCAKGSASCWSDGRTSANRAFSISLPVTPSPSSRRSPAPRAMRCTRRSR